MVDNSQVFASGKIAVITGAASGMGKGMARVCAKRGMKVVMADYDAAALPGAEAEVKGLGAEVLAVTMDVKVMADWARLLAETTKRFGEPPAFFHNNAGGGGSDFVLNIWETDENSWKHTLDLNLHGCLNGIRTMIPAMLANKKPGCIVNTASVGGLLNLPLSSNGGGTPYMVAKHGVVVISESLENDLRRQKAPISAHVLCPNGIASNFGKNMVKTQEGPKRIDTLNARFQQGLDKVGEDPEHLAETVVSTCLNAGKNGKAGFYIIGTDKTTGPTVTHEMMKWRADDIALDRPAMSQTMPTYAKEYAEKVRQARQRGGYDDPSKL